MDNMKAKKQAKRRPEFYGDIEIARERNVMYPIAVFAFTDERK